MPDGVLEWSANLLPAPPHIIEGLSGGVGLYLSSGFICPEQKIDGQSISNEFIDFGAPLQLISEESTDRT